MKMEDTPHKLLSMIMYCFPSPRRTVQVANKSAQFAYFCCPFSPGRVWSCRPPAIPALQRTGLCRPAPPSCHEERKSGLASPFVSFPRPGSLPVFGSAAVGGGRRGSTHAPALDSGKAQTRGTMPRKPDLRTAAMRGGGLPCRAGPP